LSRAHVLVVVLAVLLLRLPFLDIGPQWDDYNYLTAARYALAHPAHPSHVEYVFLGERVSMRGHPHPPGVAWMLAGLMAVLGPYRAVPFHAAWLVFSVVAALSMLALARRFVPQRALEATLLFLVVPASMVSGTSLESDLPFLAFWTLSVALFAAAEERRSVPLLIGAAVSAAAASMVAYTAFLLAGVFALYLRWKRSDWKAAWAVTAVPFVVIGAYQLFEWLTGGALPASQLAGNFEAYRLQRLGNKLRSAVAETAHLGLLLSPVVWAALVRGAPRWTWAAGLLAAAAGAAADPNPWFWLPLGFGAFALAWMASRWNVEEDRFLTGWVLLYWVAALAIFFAGAARYLLPLAAPAALLAARALEQRRTWLHVGIAAGLCLGLAAAAVNAAYWNSCRDFTRAALALAGGHRVWVSGEWGLRETAEALGAQPLERGTLLAPGDFLMRSALIGQILFESGGNRLAPRARWVVAPWPPLRIVGLDARSSYATAAFGLRPFGWSSGPVDILTLDEAVPVPPALAWLPMSAPETETQIVSGVYGLEAGQWRWMSGRAVFRLKPPATAEPVRAQIAIPDAVPGRTVRMELDGRVIAERTFPAPGTYTLESAPLAPGPGDVTLTLTIDRTMQPPGDGRRLGMIVSAVGFKR
jgi:4-amino-4-deoxy-L-arabinose transferase-like glycosyltransferase